MAHNIPTHSPHAAARRLLDVPAVAAELGINPRTVRLMFDKREVPLVRIGRRVFVWSDDLANHLAACEQPARIGAAR